MKLVQCLVLSVSVLLCVGSDVFGWYPFSERYEKWQQDRPLMYGAWHRCEPSDRIEDRMARFKAAGLNTFFWQKPHRAKAYFEAASRQGLQWQAGMSKKKPWEPTDEVNQILLDFIREVPGCAAIHVEDEPITTGLSKQEADAVYRELKARIDWVRDEVPDILAFASLSLLSIDLEEYVRRCQPDVFSYDMYPLLRDGRLEEGYLAYLKTARDVTRKYRLPFWMILQSFGRDITDSVPYRIPSESDMRFLAFTFLAHGGIGMQFFMYHGTPESMIQVPGVSPQQEFLAGGDPVAYTQTYPSSSYYAVRDMAPEIQTLGRALLQLRPTQVLGYVGQTTPGVARFEGHRSLRQVSVVDSPDSPVLIAFFDDQHGEEYFMLVNCQHGAGLSKVDAARQIQMRFHSRVTKVERLNRLTGRIEILDTTSADRGARDLAIYLPGGTGDLFKWHTGKPWSIRPE